MKFLEYAKHIGADEHLINWTKTTLEKAIAKEKKTTEEVEHILDYLVQSGKRLERMSYDQALKLTLAWDKAQQKKGNGVKELPSDTEVVLDFKDGFKVVKLIGENAYKREGFLMRHCVGSYFGKSVEIYSLRDKDNMPHCTMEKDQQIKGKGNGDISPKYIDYVIKFLEHIGMNVGDSEMKHLGYINMFDFKDELHKDTKYFKDKYLPVGEKLIDVDGNEFFSPNLFRIIPLLEKTENGLKINFNLVTVAKLSFEWISKKVKVSKESSATSGEYAHSATSGSRASSATSGYGAHSATSGEYAHSATSGEYAHSATSGEYAHSATSGSRASSATSGYGAHSATSGEYAHSATSGEYAHSATSGSRAHSATSGSRAHSATSGEYAHSATSGEYAHSATSGYGANSATSGEYAHSATSGEYAHSATSGNDAHSATSGEYAHSATSGSRANSATSGYGAHSATSGNDAIAVSVGRKSKAKASIGCFIVLAEWKEGETFTDAKPICIISAKVDGKKIKADTWYKAVGGGFIETDGSNE